MSQIFRLYEPIKVFEESSLLTFSDDAHHIVSRVLRMEEGDFLEILNGEGLIASVKIVAMDKKRFQVSVENVKTIQPPETEIRLYIGCLKGEKLSWVAQKATELGVAEINFFLSDHSVAMKSEHILEKTKKTLIEAIRQSGNPFLPKLHFFKELGDIDFEKQSDSWNILLDEKEDMPFSNILQGKKPKTVSLFVGPEGGFSDQERVFFKGHGFSFAKIAPYVLRADTAAVSAIAIFRAVFL